jgi:hypothetical protein
MIEILDWGLKQKYLHNILMTDRYAFKYNSIVAVIMSTMRLILSKFKSFPWVNSVNIRRATLAFFVIFFLSGAIGFKDYGSSWDEPMNFAFGGYTLITAADFFHGQPMKPFTLDGAADDHASTHGSAFDSLLFLIYKATSATDSRATLLARHFFCFLLFFLGVLTFYRLSRLHFKSRAWSLLATVFLTLSPRIYADAFYNSVDITFMCAFIFWAYTLRKLIIRLNSKYLAYHILASAFLMNTRPIGVYGFLMTGLFLFLLMIQKWANGKVTMKIARYFLMYFAGWMIFLIILKPYLWQDTVARLIELFTSSNKVMLRGSVLYFGSLISVTDLPWHYNFAWLLITTPLLYSITFLIGTLRYFYELIKKPVSMLNPESDSLFLLWFWVPMIAPVLLKTVLYDAWRHHFFVYPAFIIFSVNGLRATYRHLRTLKPSLTSKLSVTALVVLCFFSLASTAAFMIRFHPLQNLYFNFLAGKRSKIISRFDVDYWGLSYRKCLEAILRHDKRSSIRIAIANFPVWCNLLLLEEKDRQRFVVDSSFKTAHYYIGNFRGSPAGYPFLNNEVYSVNVDGIKVSAVYKLNN